MKSKEGWRLSIPLAVYFCCIFVAASRFALDITPGSSQVKTVGTGIIFTCTVTGLNPDDKPPNITWLYPRDVTDSVSAGRIMLEVGPLTLRLYIRRIEEEDAGKYTCEGRSLADDGQIERTEIELLIFEDIQFQESQIYFRHVIGDDAFLACAATGQPEPTISWRFNRQKIPTDTSKYIYDQGGLRIFSILPNDAGDYECRAEVAAQGNFKVRVVTLDVLFAPVITQTPNSTVAIKGSDVTFMCAANGNPPVKFEWFLEQKASQHVNVRVKLSDGSDTYKIEKIRERDEGRYYCRVSNTLGTREMHADITLMIPPSVLELPHKVVLEGKNVTIPCEATGTPVPTLLWTRVGTKEEENINVPYLESEGRIRVASVISGHSRLIIDNAAQSDAGFYTCTARNEAGQDAKNATLTVEFAPTVNTAETELFGWANQTRNFTCIGYGIPLPTLNWYRDGLQYLSDNASYTIGNSRTDVAVCVLQVNIGKAQAWIYGSYSCIAKNQHGYQTKTVSLKEAKTPDTPGEVRVVKATPTSVILDVGKPRRPGGEPQTSWLVTYVHLDRPNEEHVKSIQSGEIIEINDLEPGTSYIFYISAENKVGIGKSVKFTVNTPEEVEQDRLADISIRTNVGPKVSKEEPAEEKGSKDAVLSSPKLGEDSMGHHNAGMVSPPETGVQREKNDGSSGGIGGMNLPMVVGLVVAMVLLVLGVAGLIFCLRRRRANREQKAKRYPRLLSDKHHQQQQQMPLTPLQSFAVPMYVDNVQLESMCNCGGEDKQPLQQGREEVSSSSSSSGMQALVDIRTTTTTVKRVTTIVNPLAEIGSVPRFVTSVTPKEPSNAGSLEKSQRAGVGGSGGFEGGGRGGGGGLSQDPAGIRRQQLPPQRHQQQLFTRQNNEPRDLSSVGMADKRFDRISSSDLPPPPSYMLGNEDEDIICELSSIQDILDGYHSSGDNVDDGDDSNYRVRVPTVYERSNYSANV